MVEADAEAEMGRGEPVLGAQSAGDVESDCSDSRRQQRGEVRARMLARFAGWRIIERTVTLICYMHTRGGSNQQQLQQPVVCDCYVGLARTVVQYSTALVSLRRHIPRWFTLDWHVTFIPPLAELIFARALASS